MWCLYITVRTQYMCSYTSAIVVQLALVQVPTTIASVGFLMPRNKLNNIQDQFVELRRYHGGDGDINK